MSNHLIIGLGGTGGKVIRELRKHILRECGSLCTPNDTFLEYIYVDSSHNDLYDNDPQWKLLGQKYNLSNRQKVSINEFDFKHFMHHPAIISLLSPEEKELVDISAFFSGIIHGLHAPQRRRLGRLLLAQNIDGFIPVLCESVRSLQNQSGHIDVTFDICAGLAGGTGSGTLIDAITQIRKYFPFTLKHEFKIRLFLYVPEEAIEHPTYNYGYYQANGYAAFAELNALSCGFYSPMDISGDIDHSTGQRVRLNLGQDSFQTAYLYTNVNEAGMVKDIEASLPESVALFLYENIVNAHEMPSICCEEHLPGPDYNIQGLPVRSRRFMSFGITKIVFPESEIKELVTYTLACDVLKRLVWNHWVPNTGYVENDNVNISELRNEIESFEFQCRFFLTEQHLTLERPIEIIKEASQWRDYESTWRHVIGRFSETLRPFYIYSNHDECLYEFKEKCEEYYQVGFRNCGVEKFFSRQDIQFFANIISRRIEESYFNEWTDATKGLVQIEDSVSVICQMLNLRRETFLHELQSLFEKLKSLNDELHRIEMECNNHIHLMLFFHRLSQSYIKATLQHYILRTKIESLKFAIELVNALQVRLNDICCIVRTVNCEYRNKLEAYQRSTLDFCTNQDLRSNSVLKIFNRETVLNAVKGYSADMLLQNDIMDVVRNVLVRQISSFRQYNGVDLNSVLSSLSVQADQALRQSAAINSTNRLIDANIWEKIHEQFSENIDLQQFASTVAHTICTNLPMNTGTSYNSAICVSLPEAIDALTNNVKNDFINELSTALVLHGTPVISAHGKSNEIVITSVNAGFPLCGFRNLKVLKDQYDKLVDRHNPNHELNRMVLHTESFDYDITNNIYS